MCLVLDTCALSSVLNKKAQDHHLFEPVWRWVIEGRGKFVYGGSKYKSELRRAKKYLRIMAQLKKGGKVVEVGDDGVDEIERQIEEQYGEREFNDAHLIAIVIASRCLIICTNDRKAIPYLRRTQYYRPARRPRLYTGHSSHRTLLRDDNIAGICKPAEKGTRELGDLF